MLNLPHPLRCWWLTLPLAMQERYTCRTAPFIGITQVVTDHVIIRQEYLRRFPKQHLT